MAWTKNVLRVNLEAGTCTVAGTAHPFPPLPPQIRSMLLAGGLWAAKKGTAVASDPHAMKERGEAAPRGTLAEKVMGRLAGPFLLVQSAAPLVMAYVIEHTSDPAALALAAGFASIALICFFVIRRPG
jgi:hypothetical protein